MSFTAKAVVVSFIAVSAAAQLAAQQRPADASERLPVRLRAEGGGEWAAFDRAHAVATQFGIGLAPALAAAAQERAVPAGIGGPFRYQLIVAKVDGATMTVNAFRSGENDIALRLIDHATILAGGDEESLLRGDPIVVEYDRARGEKLAFGFVVEGDTWVHQVVLAGGDLPAYREMLAGLRLAGRELQLPTHMPRVPAPQAASCCGITDSYSNSYACCDGNTLGNCTWYAEMRTPGANNFYFDGSNRNAYRWLTKAHDYNAATSSIGGTIPVAGAVVMLTTKYAAGTGHVAYIESVNSDGSINVREQNYCDPGCTLQKTYTVDQLRQYLGGYIYPSTTRPSPTPKWINGTYGVQTSVDDHNRTNVFNFSAEGPGFFSSYNSANGVNERMWGTGGFSTGYFHWMAASTSTSLNSGKWAIDIGAAGSYKIEAFIPNDTLITATRARYKVAMNGPIVYSSPVNQSANRGAYVQVLNPNRVDGLWYFPAGAAGNGVRLEDNYGGNNPESGVNIALDALRFTRY